MMDYDINCKAGDIIIWNDNANVLYLYLFKHEKTWNHAILDLRTGALEYTGNLSNYFWRKIEI